MARRPRDQLFKKTDIYRLVEAARAKNLPVARIDVKRDGLSLVIGDQSSPNGDVETKQPNEWDSVYGSSDHA